MQSWTVYLHAKLGIATMPLGVYLHAKPQEEKEDDEEWQWTRGS